jgi:hypothetical protein
MDKALNILSIGVIVLGLVVGGLIGYVKLNTFHAAPSQQCEMAVVVDHFHYPSCGVLRQQRGY